MALPDFTVGTNMDHPHMKGRFTLRIWVPVEQTALVAGKCGDIKRELAVKSVDCPVAPSGLLWSPVVITGDPTSSFKAYQAIAEIVEEVDNVAVAEFPLHLSRRPIVVGPQGATLKRISAANAVRIMVPSEKDAAAQNQHQQGWSTSSSVRDKNLVVQLEGGVEAVFSALAMVMEAVYGCPAATLVTGLPPTQNSASSGAPTAASALAGVPPAAGGVSDARAGRSRPQQQALTSTYRVNDGEERHTAVPEGKQQPQQQQQQQRVQKTAGGSQPVAAATTKTATSSHQQQAEQGQPAAATVAAPPQQQETAPRGRGQQQKQQQANARAAGSVPSRGDGQPIAAAAIHSVTRGSGGAQEQSSSPRTTNAQRGTTAPQRQTNQAIQERHPQQQQQRGQVRVVVPISGPLPSAERSEEKVLLPASVITVLKGQAKSKSSGSPVVKWLILKDIQKHTGTTATVISMPRVGADGGGAGAVIAAPAAATTGTAAAASTGQATPSATAADDGDDEALVLLIKGPTNCVEVAVEALRKLGRKEAVRDALTFVKTTSPHRRLTQQRRQEQPQQQQQQGSDNTSDNTAVRLQQDAQKGGNDQGNNNRNTPARVQPQVTRRDGGGRAPPHHPPRPVYSAAAAAAAAAASSPRNSSSSSAARDKKGGPPPKPGRNSSNVSVALKEESVGGSRQTVAGGRGRDGGGDGRNGEKEAALHRPSGGDAERGGRGAGAARGRGRGRGHHSGHDSRPQQLAPSHDAQQQQLQGGEGEGGERQSGPSAKASNKPARNKRSGSSRGGRRPKAIGAREEEGTKKDVVNPR